MLMEGQKIKLEFSNKGDGGGPKNKKDLAFPKPMPWFSKKCNKQAGAELCQAQLKFRFEV